MESGKRATGVMALLAMMVVLQLMSAAPTTMARKLQQDTSPVLTLNNIAREFSWGYKVPVPCLESCYFSSRCGTIFGATCRCLYGMCVHDV
ncbi:hypothetical protein HU200_052870 [Digitaria exilis]|uniref:Uncharacterized protein n=1 Tax=Digitaria exilis TaxID=1010633 RepID=A0A835AKV5_9POAL|nr:hypothetical protein HU200_052870 [Digitaria exilis]